MCTRGPNNGSQQVPFLSKIGISRAARHQISASGGISIILSFVCLCLCRRRCFMICQKATFYVLALIGFRFAWFCACQCVPLQFIGSQERDFHPKCGFVFSSCDLIFAAGGIFDSTGSTERRGSSAKVQLGSTSSGTRPRHCGYHTGI